MCDCPQHVCSEWGAGWGGGLVTAGYHPCGCTDDDDDDDVDVYEDDDDDVDEDDDDDDDDVDVDHHSVIIMGCLGHIYSFESLNHVCWIVDKASSLQTSISSQKV